MVQEIVKKSEGKSQEGAGSSKGHSAVNSQSSSKRNQQGRGIMRQKNQ